MKLTVLLLQVATLAALHTAGVAMAQSAQLRPQRERISDEAIHKDQQAYEGMQGRIRALNEKGRPVSDYHLSKAQCWLDVSFHEYTRNDRGPFPQAALTESEKLVKGMEAGMSPLPMDTPLVGQAVKLRPDLWERADALKKSQGFSCAQQKVACAEVELVHAGNEQTQQQWRHAKPYVQIAEDLLGEAQVLAARCMPAAVAAATTATPTPAAAPAVLAPTQELRLQAHVVFNFDRHEASQMRRFSVDELDALAARIRNERLDVQRVLIVGHADRLNSTGQADYNKRLSERRVQTVREALVQRGIDGKLIEAEARGDREQVQACRNAGRSIAVTQECLLPNRRVEILLIAIRRPG